MKRPSIRVYRARTGHHCLELHDGEHEVMRAALHPDGGLIVSLTVWLPHLKHGNTYMQCSGTAAAFKLSGALHGFWHDSEAIEGEEIRALASAAKPIWLAQHATAEAA